MDDSKLQPEAYDDYVLDEQIGYVLRMANQRHAGIFQSLIRRDLTPTQFSVLIRLSEKGELSQNFLGRLVALDTATTKGVIDRLRAKSLIQSRPDDADKRRAIISLTDEGRAAIEMLKEDGRRISEKTLGSLTLSDRRRLLHLLNKIV